MYYKVLKNNDVVDVLNRISYVKYQEKHDILLFCNIQDAQAILSSDGRTAWHIEGLYNFPLDNTECEIIEITKQEYEKLKER